MTSVLGIDSSTSRVEVAAMTGGEIVAEASHAPPAEGGRPRHSELLLAECDAAVGALGGWESLGLIAVGVGPGSFTGLRIGIATARALAQAREIPIVPVSSLSALAAGIRASAPGAACLAVIDARRGEAFAALEGAGGEELWPPFVASPDQLAARVGELPAGPVAGGDGSLRFREELEAAGATVAAPGDEVHRVAARHICELGLGASPVAPEEIEPTYMRAPDAERWLERDN